MEKKLKYADEKDKSFGLAGMAISLIACDSEEYIASVSLEKTEEPFAMTCDYFFDGNPGMFAKKAWNELLKQYQVCVGMLIGNILCRYAIIGKRPESSVLQSVHTIAKSLGEEYCSLEEDEINELFNKIYQHYGQLFTHPSVVNVARNFATTLRMRRRMSAAEVLEELSQLNHA